MRKARTLPEPAKANGRSSRPKRIRISGNGSIQDQAKASINDAPKRRRIAHKKAADVFAFSYAATDDNNALAIIDAVRSGISAAAFNDIAKSTPFTMAEWAVYLQLSERTIQRNQKEQKSFQPIQSERIIELAMLYQYGIDVFGDKDNFAVWLNSASVAMGGSPPKSFLDTKFGMGMVKDELGRIEHGVLA